MFFQGHMEFSFRFPKRRLYTTAATHMAKANDVLVSIRALVGEINVAYEECCIGRGLCYEQKCCLEAIRDFLLPKLISGEITP